MIDIEIDGDLRVIRLAHGVTNPIGFDLLDRLGGALEEVALDPDTRGVVLTGSNEKFFSIGWDLPALLDLDRAIFREFLSAYHRVTLQLYALPLPTVAALGGHAVAGGCLLAVACDWRILAEGRTRMGVNEVKLGVPIPWSGDRMLRQVVGERAAREIVEGGELVLPERAAELGLADRVVSPGDVEREAKDLARQLGAAPRAGFAATKHNRTDPTLAVIHEQLAERDEAFLERWFAESTRALLRKAAEAF